MCRHRSNRARRGRQSGLTFTELLIASAIMGMLALAMSALAFGVQNAAKQANGQGLAVQHARVALDRIERNLNNAIASEQFPGAAVFNTTAGVWNLPETLVIWRPTGNPVDATGLPRFNELIVYCPSSTDPTKLLEITVPSDSRIVPALASTATWKTELTTMKSSSNSVKNTLTDLLRTCDAGYSSSLAGTSSQGSTAFAQLIGQMYPGWQAVDLHGAARFEFEQHPTAAEWASYKAGNLAWENINWPQGRYGAKTGLGYACCRIELQLVPGNDSRVSDPDGNLAAPFLGSGAVNYQLNR